MINMKIYVVAMTKSDAKKSPDIFTRISEARRLRKQKGKLTNHIYIYDSTVPKYVRSYTKVE